MILLTACFTFDLASFQWNFPLNSTDENAKTCYELDTIYSGHAATTSMRFRINITAILSFISLIYDSLQLQCGRDADYINSWFNLVVCWITQFSRKHHSYRRQFKDSKGIRMFAISQSEIYFVFLFELHRTTDSVIYCFIIIETMILFIFKNVWKGRVYVKRSNDCCGYGFDYSNILDLLTILTWRICCRAQEKSVNDYDIEISIHLF